MVSINNNVNSLSGLNNSQTLVKSRQNVADNLSKKSSQKFSTLLDNTQKNNTLSKKIEKPAENISGYSPLMLRYGMNRINEIKDIAAAQGVNDLTNEDFDYAIRYGRSIIADYLI